MTDITTLPAVVPEIADLVITRGRCHALFAYDIGMQVDLDEANRLVKEAATQREQIRHRRRAPRHFEFQPLPLRITQAADPIRLGAFTTSASVDLVVYDFAAVLVVYTIPLGGPLQDLLPLADVLYANEDLLADSRHRVELLAETIAPAVMNPVISDAVEDYLSYVIESFSESTSIAGFVAQHRGLLAQILRSEMTPLSEQEVGDALQCHLSFGPNDLTLIDWNAAFIFDPDAYDVVAVLEYANVELLEMRHLDHKLDDALEQAYRVLSEQQRPGWLLGGSGHGSDLSRVARLQVDSALLFEGVNNSLKLLGDQYLARVYQLASQRFHLAEWDASILRKLATLESIYTKMSDRAAGVRMEVLEWIIIILILISILLPFIPGIPKH